MLSWRVLLVEDDPDMCDFFAASVERCELLHLAGVANSTAQARACIESLPGLDVLLTDLGLPDGSGLEVLRYVRSKQPKCEALVISVFGDEENVLASIEAGALGYIHKDAAPEHISRVILEMKAGASPISPMIARGLLSRLQQGTIDERASVKPLNLSHKLSNREQEVLELIGRGFSYSEIAKVKSITVHTVQSHVKNLYKKLEVNSRTQAVYEATRMGLLAPPTT